MRRALIVAGIVLALALPSSPADATGLPVIDAANLVQNIEQYVQDFQQLEQMYRDYEAFITQYRDFKVNWKTYLVGRLLMARSQHNDPRFGYSLFRIARYLQPDGNWRADIETVIKAHYRVHDQPEMFRSLVSLYANDKSLQSLLSEYGTEYTHRTHAMDPYYVQAAQYRASENRLTALDDLSRQLASLTDRSETAQLQTIGATLITIGQQNETTINALHMIATQASAQMLREQDDRQRARDLEYERLRSVQPLPAPGCGSMCYGGW
jgi:conjugal transfer/entry exclusion protein